MYIEVNVEESIVKSIQEALNGDLIKTAIEERVSRLVRNVIDEQTSAYSDFGKLVRDEIKGMLPQAISIDNQSNFRDAILKIVEKNIAGYRDKQLKDRLNEMMSDLLKKTPATIQLSELIKYAARMWEVSEPSVHIDVSSGVVAGYTNVYLDKERNKGKFSCSCSIAMTDSGKVYSIKVHGQDMRDSLFVGPIYEFERYLFWLYTGGTIVEIDVTDPNDIYFPEREEEETDEEY
jgi:hypothetical protein